MKNLRTVRGLVLLLALASAPLAAKPIAYQHGGTALYEYSPHRQESQLFYAPDHRLSLGGGWLRLSPDAEHGHAHGPGDYALDIGYLRANVLAERWNGPESQANLYYWGGLGVADTGEEPGLAAVPNAGLQADWETRRWYVSAQTDWHASFAFATGSSTVQLGIAPYLHDYDTLATWIVLQGQSFDGDMLEERSAALLLRFFWRSIWLEAGADQDGKPHGMLMLNF